MSFLDNYPSSADQTDRPVGPNLIGEPVIRPDGKRLTLHDSGHGSLFIHVEGKGFYYSGEEVLLMGNGDLEAGYKAIGRIAYEADTSETYDIFTRPGIEGHSDESS